MSASQIPDKTKGLADEKLTLGSVRHLIRAVDWRTHALRLAETWKYFRQLNGPELSAAYFAMIGGCL